ncbi:MAG: TonB-dependent receptor [Rhodocyclaceae bacterium]|nr:TonB-dependent receptor [Rhodocyclaceae bacterium]
MRLHTRLLTSLLCTCATSAGVIAAGLSEQDYFSELPVVLTVSRLTQPLSETPGAVTIIDKEIIRRSGARELADVLRLVPGYLAGGFNGANPGAVYHAPLDDFGTRNLVLIDGRSVYSSLFLGGTHRGMMGVLLEDIERVEVLRGSNAAAYGANAMFGVINVITRHAGDTHGAEVSVTGGAGGIADNYVRIGWSGGAGSFRLTAGRRKDSGYLHAYDDKIISQMHFRGDLRPTADQELTFSAGIMQQTAGDGFPDRADNPERSTHWRDTYLQGQWRRQLSATDEIRLSANYNEEHLRDSSVYEPDPSVTLEYSGRGRRFNLELQHQVELAPSLRAVWGAGYKYEDARSLSLYATDTPLAMHEERLFGNLEWRPHPQWLINAGGFWGKHSWKGAYFSPRLMANLHVIPDHTLRIGATQSARMPSFFEMAGDIRYYPQNLEPFKTLRAPPFNFILPYRTIAATGNVGPEKLFAQEIGYFGHFRDWRLTLDMRAFHERFKDGVNTNGYDIVIPTPLGALPWRVTDYINERGFKSRGFEYQLRWKPLDGTEIWVNQNFMRLLWDDKWNHHLPPTHATTLALFQKLPFELDLSVLYHTTGAMTWRDQERSLPSRRRLDVRLAWPFRIGATRAEAAVTVQAANGNHTASIPYQNHILMFDRRAYGTLRFEF